MSEFTEAFEELTEAQEEADGDLVTTIAINGGTPFPCVVSSFNTDLIAIPGASAEAGGYSVQVLASYFGNVEPAKYSPVVLSIATDNTNLEVLSVSSSHGVFTITINDPAAND